MSHSHAHSHTHTTAPVHLNRAFLIGIGMNLIFVVGEVVAGLYAHSLSLLADAGHNLADVGSLALSLLAFRLMKRRPDERYTYGYKKTSVLVALFNAVILLVSMGAIAYEAMHRLLNPAPVPGVTVAVVAGIGIIINGISAIFFLNDKDKDLNIKSAYLHLMSDAAISAGLVVGGIIIYLTSLYWIDTLLSLFLAILIVINTWQLLSHSLRLSLDGVPVQINLDRIRAEALAVEGVAGIHHIHVWAISTNENALTAHVVLKSGALQVSEPEIKHRLRHAFEHENIHHITLETEYEGALCEEANC